MRTFALYFSMTRDAVSASFIPLIFGHYENLLSDMRNSERGYGSRQPAHHSVINAEIALSAQRANIGFSNLVQLY